MKLTRGVYFINVLHTAFALIDPESVKITVKALVSFTLLGSTSVKAVSSTQMKLTPGRVRAEYAKLFMLGLAWLDRVFHGFGQTKFACGGSVLGSSQFTLLSQLPLKTMLSLKWSKWTKNKQMLIKMFFQPCQNRLKIMNSLH